jgi:hypothetical protein
MTTTQNNNFQLLAGYLNSSLSSTQNSVNTFFSSQTETNYNLMRTALNDQQTAIYTPVNQFRILVSASDGTVAYDGSINDDTNTFSNFLNKTINDNHNTRPEIMVATLNSSGTGLAARYSSSVAKNLLYNANRLGSSVNENVGTYRCSITSA